MKKTALSILLLLTFFGNCNQPPFTKLNNDTVSGKDVRTALEAYLVPTSLVNAAANSIIIKIVTGIKDSGYYTRESLDSCRQKLDLLRILGNDLIILSTCNIKEVKAI